MDDLARLDAYLPEDLRVEVEQRYYARINRQASLEALVTNREFLDEPERHVAFFSDHGVVHVRDVALQILQVLDTAHGVLIPEREPERLRFMKAYGVLAAYLHDIGMADFSQFGRAMHCEYATQAVMGRELDDFVGRVWDQNIGNLAWRLTNLEAKGALGQPPRVVLREMLAMANCHSKRAVPVADLGNPVRLAARMRYTAFVPLRRQYEAKHSGRATAGRDHDRDEGPVAFTTAHLSGQLNDAYRTPEEAFCWLTEPRRETRQLAEDVVDALRALRCADALRQRGTVQKTSGGYEVFINYRTADAIYAMRYGDDRLYLVDFPNHISAGEANIASSELESSGRLRVTFHLGSFPSEAALEMAVKSAAIVIRDIRSDVVASFAREGPTGQTPIVLESVADSPDFAVLVARRLKDLDPDGGDVEVASNLQGASSQERGRYMRSSELDWDLALRRTVLEKIGRTGHKTASIDPVEGLREVRLARLEAGERLMQAGDPAGFVYIPLGAGCVGLPLGGYQPFAVPPWAPLGVTGVIRHASRNATIVAEQEVELLVIPKDVYLRHWHHTYSLDEFIDVLRRDHAGRSPEPPSLGDSGDRPGLPASAAV